MQTDFSKAFDKVNHKLLLHKFVSVTKELNKSNFEMSHLKLLKCNLVYHRPVMPILAKKKSIFSDEAHFDFRGYEKPTHPKRVTV